MDWSFRRNWDEYTWSQEIRKDERRIACYFRTLPECLDLPGEDELIFDKLMSQKDLLPTGVSNPQQILAEEFDYSEEDDSEWECERRIVRQSDSFAPVRKVKKMVVQWNLLAASLFDELDLHRVLAVTCALGKLLSRIYNFEENEDTHETLNLRISLLKQMLLDLNEVMKNLLELLDDFPTEQAANLRSVFDQLSFVREDIVHHINVLRKKHR